MMTVSGIHERVTVRYVPAGCADRPARATNATPHGYWMSRLSHSASRPSSAGVNAVAASGSTALRPMA